MVDVTDTSLATKKTNIAPKRRLFPVPHLLPVKPFVPPSATSPLYKIFYHFPNQFIPHSLVDQLIVNCAEWNKKHNFGFIEQV